MEYLLVLLVALATCRGSYIPVQPHEVYGVPSEYQKNTQNLVLPKNLLPIEEKVPAPSPHDSYGVPKEVKTLSDEEVPAQIPHEEYGVPFHDQREEKPVVTHYEYVLPHQDPVFHDEEPVVPQEEYGVPHQKEIVTQYEYTLPHHQVPTISHDEDVPNQPHTEYGIPNHDEVPHEEYGVPHHEVVETHYEYSIPHQNPTVFRDEVPEQPHDQYGVPNQIRDEVPYYEEVVTPVQTQYEYAFPHVVKQRVLPQNDCDEYGVPLIKKLVPLLINNNPQIPNQNIQRLVVSNRVIVPHEVYGVPNQ